MDHPFLQAALTVLFGALAGGLTNAVAIWMLFHPHQPRGLGRLKIQGAIPKNRARLARTVGHTVGQRLLTGEDFQHHLAAPEIRRTFDAAVRSFIAQQLQLERGALRSELPPALVAELEQILRTLATNLAARLADFAATAEFREAVDRLLARAIADVGERPIGQLLTEARRAAIRQKAAQLLESVVSSPELERILQESLEIQVRNWEQDDAPLRDRLPPSLVAAPEEAAGFYLPKVLDRLAGALASVETRQRTHQALHQLFQRLARNLLPHERLAAKLLITERTIARLLETFETEGAEELGRLLEEPGIRSELVGVLRQALVSWLRQPVKDVITGLGPERVRRALREVARHWTGMLRRSATREYLLARLDEALAKAEERTLGDVLSRLPAEQIGAALSEAGASTPVKGWLESAATAAFQAILDRPIGRLEALIPADRLESAAAALSEVLWEWAQRQVPAVVEKIDLETMVERKVMGFSLERLEELVRQTTQRELDLIVRLGYLLGGLVGAVAYVVSRWVMGSL